MQILRLSNPAAFQHPVVYHFLVTAAESCNYGSPQAVIKDLAGMIENPSIGCWMAIGDDGPEAIAMVMLPQSAFMECPQVLMLYNKDMNSLALKGVTDKAIEFMKENGYTRAWGINRSGRSPKVIQRLCKGFGEATVIGELMEYK